LAGAADKNPVLTGTFQKYSRRNFSNNFYPLRSIMNATESSIEKKTAVQKHKEFLFPAVATYYQEPIALVKGEGSHVWDDGKRRPRQPAR
jgi:hypothetical protein